MKLKIALLASLLGLLSCHPSTNKMEEAYPKTGVAKNTVPVSSGTQSRKQKPRLDTLGGIDDFILLGDSLEVPKDNGIMVLLKFKPYVRFSDFHAAKLKQHDATIQYSSNKLAREYRTAIMETYNEEGINFGGHYCFVSWGCGSPCQMSALVDLKTGIVYEGTSAAYGYEFRNDSRLLLVNPPDSTGFYHSGGIAEPEVYVWNEVAKKFEQR